MRLSYLIPTLHYEFFRELIAPLREAGVDVAVNEIPEGTDLILCGILPATPSWIDPVLASRVPYILWHWDLYSFVDMREARWASFLAMLHTAADIWSCSYETARQLRELLGLSSTVMSAWVREENLKVRGHVKDTVFYAASSAAFGKRVDWAQHACKLLGYPLTLTTRQSLPREEYFRTLAQCRVYLMPAFEESNGTIPALEAAASGAPVVVADIPSNREVFGDTADYFQTWDFRSLLTTLRGAWDRRGRPLDGAVHRALSLYGLRPLRHDILRRLGEVYAHLQARPR